MLTLMWIMICVLTGTIMYLVVRIEQLNDMITEILKLVDGNTKLIGKVQDFSFHTSDQMFDIWRRHLEVHHGVSFEEGLKDKEEE